MTKFGFYAATVGAFLTACGGGSTNSSDDSFTVQWGPFEVPAGVEDTRCLVKGIATTETIHAHELHNVLGATSHHFIVYRVNDTEERPEPFPCTPFIETLDPTRGAPLMITQKADDRLILPEGVAYTLEPNQMIRLELHYINVQADAQMAEATSTFIPIPEEELEAEADIVFMGTADITIPPMDTATSGPTFIGVPPTLNGVNYFAITGHEHQWGTDVYVETAAGPGLSGTAVYDVPQFLWDEPETVEHDPPFTLPDGGGFNLTCQWDNRSDKTVGFGTSVDDEMCFFWAYYYPSSGPVVCVNDLAGFDLCCPGGALCDLIPPL